MLLVHPDAQVMVVREPLVRADAAQGVTSRISSGEAEVIGEGMHCCNLSMGMLHSSTRPQAGVGNAGQHATR